MAKRRSAEKQLWYEASRRALRDGLLFTLKIEDIKIPQFCPALGIPLFQSHGTGLPGPNSPTLDRVDNTQGYTKRNVCVISYRANVLKKDGTGDEMEAIARYMRAYEPIRTATSEICHFCGSRLERVNNASDLDMIVHEKTDTNPCTLV